MPITKVRLTLMIDKRVNRVIFAEAEKVFVDFLFNLLSLPVGTVIRLLRNASIFGCIGNLYLSLENLNDAHLQPNKGREKLLKTAVLLNPPSMMPEASPKYIGRKLYKCENGCYVTDAQNINCPGYICSRTVKQYLRFVDSGTYRKASASEGGIVKNLVTYMVTDDLSGTPVSMISGFDLLECRGYWSA